MKGLIIIIDGGILSLTDSHHHHCGQIPTMAGICHGGNKSLGHDMTIMISTISNHCICGKDKEKEMVANKGSSCSGPVLLDLLFA